MRVAAYIRVSTSEQAENGYGLAAQEQQIVRDVLARDWQLVDVFRDEGESGKSLDRPRLRGALELIAAGGADCLMVAKLDRLTRSAPDFAALLEWFGRVGAELVALDLAVDTSTPGGKLVAQVFAVVAEWERDVISQRTRDGLAAVRASGRAISRPALSERPEVAERVRVLRAEGLSLAAICDRLNGEHVPTVRGGSEWRPSALVTLLSGARAPRRRRVAVLPTIKKRGVR